MKATITPVPQYRVQVEGVDLGLFSEESPWEGFTKLVTADKQALIVEKAAGRVSAFARAVAGPNAPEDADIIKASPSLLALLGPRGVTTP